MINKSQANGNLIEICFKDVKKENQCIWNLNWEKTFCKVELEFKTKFFFFEKKFTNQVYCLCFIKNVELSFF